MPNMKENMQAIVTTDIDILLVKNAEYGESWKRRGGQGAFFTIIRKADRLEEMVRRKGYDLFAAIREDTGQGEPLLETIRDLRRYLLLLEGEVNSWHIPEETHPVSELHKTFEQYQELCEDAARYEPQHRPHKTLRQSDGMEHPFGYDDDKDIPF
jgi:hypothetical protein